MDSTRAQRFALIRAVRACIIFNPAARGNHARRFRRHLDQWTQTAELRATTAAGHARAFAAEAVREGFDTLIAAGGDGTCHEVLNGIGDVPEGFARVRLGVLPLGTVNVFARELNLPLRVEAAWGLMQSGGETRVDVGRVEFGPPAQRQTRYFLQMAGAGLDARAIELVSWRCKQWTGPLAYVWAGLRALAERPASIRLGGSYPAMPAGLVLVGNGRFYGGPFRVFPEADLRDGLLDVCMFPRVNWFTALGCGLSLLAIRRLPESAVVRVRATEFELSAPARVPLEADGELIGQLPARFTMLRQAVRVLAPTTAIRPVAPRPRTGILL